MSEDASTKRRAVTREAVILAALVIVFVGSIVLVRQYSGGLGGAIIAAVASVLAPLVGAVFTLLLVPIRKIQADASEIKQSTDSSAESLVALRELLDVRLNGLVEQLASARDSNTTLARQLGVLSTQLDRLHDSMQPGEKHE